MRFPMSGGDAHECRVDLLCLAAECLRRWLRGMLLTGHGVVDRKVWRMPISVGCQGIQRQACIERFVVFGPS